MQVVVRFCEDVHPDDWVFQPDAFATLKCQGRISGCLKESGKQILVGRVIQSMNRLKKRFPKENPGKCDLGWGHFYCKYYAKNSQKAPQNYSASFWTSNFQDSLWGKPKTPHFMVYGPGGHDHDSPNQLFLILKAPRYFKQSKKITNHFRSCYFRNSENLKP